MTRHDTDTVARRHRVQDRADSDSRDKSDDPASAARTPQTTAGETIHTTTNHPWLTADRGWLPAGDLRPGEQVERLDGSSASVVRVRIVPGVATMYNLTVIQLHTYAVGSGQFVVHNVGCFNSPPLSMSDAQFGAKAGKHAPDFGLDPRDPAARAQLRGIIYDIHDNPDEIRQGPWNPKGGGGSDYLFYRQGTNVVLTKADGEFVSILEGGASNGWYQGANIVWP